VIFVNQSVYFPVEGSSCSWGNKATDGTVVSQMLFRG